MVSNRLAIVVSMGLFGRLPLYGFPQVRKMMGSGVIFGVMRKPSRLHNTTFSTSGWFTAWYATSIAVSPAPKITTVLSPSKHFLPLYWLE